MPESTSKVPTKTTSLTRIFCEKRKTRDTKKGRSKLRTKLFVNDLLKNN